MIKKKHLYGLLIAGLISGIFSVLGLILLADVPVITYFLVIGWFYYAPGLIYGLIIGGYLKKIYVLENNRNYFFFTLLSTGGYLAAYTTFLFVTELGQYINFPLQSLGLAAAGAVGTTILLISFQLFVAHLRKTSFIILILLGSTLSLCYTFAALLPIQNALFFSIPFNQLLPLFLIWQGVMAYAIGLGINRYYSTKKNINKYLIFIMAAILATSLTAGVFLDYKNSYTSKADYEKSYNLTEDKYD